MLKKKVLSLVLALSMLSGLGIVTAQAATTDSISQVLVDASGYTQYAASWNRVSQGSIINCANVYVASGIGDDPNVCLKMQANPTVGTNTGLDKISRFATSICNADGSFGGSVSPANATKPMFWSVDVWSGSTIDYVWMTLQGAGMSPQLKMSDLVANAWNTLSVVYYPAAYLGTEKSTADFYLNGEYVQSYSNLNPAATEYRFIFKATKAEDILYLDNLKLYEMTSFTRAAVDTTNVSLTDDGKLTDYVTVTRESNAPTDYTTMTVAALETATGATVYNADGTEAADSAPVTADMYVSAVNTIEGVGTFKSGKVELTNVASVLVDSSECTVWANGWNRYGGGRSKGSYVTKDNIAIAPDGNVCVDYKTTNVDTYLRFAVSQRYWVNETTTAAGINLYPGRAEVPVYWSVDVYGNTALTDIRMGFDGETFINTTGIPATALKANAWNTIAAVHYPNLDNPAKLGSADVYVNGELWAADVDLTSKSANDMKQMILYGKGTSTDAVIYYDNSKCYLLSSFDAPEISGVTVEDGKIVDYAPQTVAEFEKATGLALKTSAGADAADADAVAAGMVAVATSAVDGVGTFTKSIELGEGKAYELGNWAVTVDGEAISGTTYGSGAALSATLPVAGTIPAMVTIIAEFNGDKFVQAITSNTTTVNCAITAGNTYKVFAWDSLTALNPLKDALVLTQQ